MIVKEEPKSCELWTVPIGGLFRYSDRFLIKTNICCLEKDNCVNCVDVRSGYLKHIDDFSFVEYFPDAFISLGERKVQKEKK